MKDHSILLSTDHSAEKNLQYTKLEERLYDMPGVMSRKKQLLPEVLHAAAV
jgi:manganese-dependent inorganic pyrophosphatase